MAVPLRLIDSHTEGEPTRVVVDGGPHLDGATMLERREELRRDWDFLRTAITAEPRASEGTVAAFLTEPVSADAAAGVVFANRAGYLGMCGHGALGVMRTLLHLGRINATNERFALDTPAGPIYATLFDDGSIEIQNVTARAFRLDVPVQVPGTGEIVGDIAYGGNWFFLVDAARAPLPEIAAGNVSRLTSLALEICAALQAHGITGEDGARIDHIELDRKSVV